MTCTRYEFYGILALLYWIHNGYMSGVRNEESVRRK